MIAVLTAVTIVVGMRIMGTMLISSLIIFPALTSMRVFSRFRTVVILSLIHICYQMHKDVMRFAQFAVRVYRCDMDFEHPERTALAGIEAHEAFLKDIGMPITLKELGARTEDIPALAAKTKKTNLADQTTGGAFPRLSLIHS